MIYYFCPDISAPSAGIKRLYRHVFHLNRKGLDASILHQKKGFVLIWHGYQVPVIWMEDQPILRAEDILVFPESATGVMQQTQHYPNTRLVIVLSWAYIFKNLPEGENWKDYGITQAITPSTYIKEFLEWSMGVTVTLIGDYVAPTRFYPPSEKKKHKIVYQARRSNVGNLLRGYLEKKGGALNDYEWTPMINFDEDQYASHLREASICLLTSEQEGTPTSALEGMATGCVVVGYTGIGGSDIMIGEGDNQNCVLVENGHLLELGQTLEKVAIDMKQQPGCYDAVIKNAVSTARRFADFEKEGDSLKRFFESLSQ